MYPGQGAPGGYPPHGGAPGGYPGAPGGYPPHGGAPGGYPPHGGAPGGYPGAPGGYPPHGGAPGGYPGAPGGYPAHGGAPGGYPAHGGAPGGYQVPPAYGHVAGPGHNPYAYREGNWSGYQMKTYSISVPKGDLKKHMERIFYQVDTNRNGFVEMHEVPMLVALLFQACGSSVPELRDVHVLLFPSPSPPIDLTSISKKYLMNKYDKNRDGRLSFKEFKKMGKKLGGMKGDKKKKKH